MDCLKKNVILMFIYQIIVLIIPLITLPYISRVLGSDKLGLFAFTESIVSYFSLFGILGIQLYGKREIAKCRDSKMEKSKVFWEIYIIQFTMSILSFILCIGLSIFIDDIYRVLLIIQSANILAVMLDITWYFFAVEKFKMIVIRNLFVKIISIILIFLVVKNSSDLYKYAIIISMTALISQCLLWFNIFKEIKFCKFLKSEIMARVKPVLKLFIPVLAVQIFSFVDKTMLGLLSDLDQVSIYQNAEKITRVPIAIITSIGVVLLPRMVHLVSKGDNTGVSESITNTLRITMFLCIGAAMGLFILADEFMPFYLGDGYDGAEIIVKILSPILIFICWGNVFRTQYILPNNLDVLYTKSVIFASLLNIVLNLCLIPFLGSVGAALASVTAEMIICMYQSIKIRKNFKLIMLMNNNSHYIISAIITICLVTLLKINFSNALLNIFLIFIIGFSSYSITTLLLECLLNRRFIIVEIANICKKVKRKHY